MSKATKEYYDKLAAIYDEATSDAWAAPKHIEAILNDLPTKDMSILDIGIGTGQSIQKLYDSEKYSHLEGIDLSDEMLSVCRAKYPNAILHHGDFLEYSIFSRKKFNLIVCCGALEFIEDIDHFFSKCKSMLEIHGSLVLTYEPLISGHTIQNASISESKSERQSVLPGFMTRRYDLDAFRTLAIRYGFDVLNERLFVSYKKLDKEIIYVLLHLKLK